MPTLFSQQSQHSLLSLSFLMDPAHSLPQRIVFLIDLHPLLKNPNPNPTDYITRIRASIHKILTFPPLSSSLFAFKLLISSLSPILSASKLHRLLGRSPPPFSFRRPLETLASLSQTLSSLNPDDATDPSPPRPSFLSKFLLQLEHDYSWEPDPTNSTGNRETLIFRANLVLLFSPVYRDFLDFGSSGFDGCSQEFCRVFGPVNEKFVSRDIHFSWISVNSDGACEFGFFERGIRGLGWGFCSTDAIVVGSALVPFGLIFPYVGFAMEFSSDCCSKKGQAELVLGITDVSGKPLECKSCNLELIKLKLGRKRPDFWALLSKSFDGSFVKIRINEIWRRDEGSKFIENSVGVALLRGVSGEYRKETADSERNFIVDRVLELLCGEKGEFVVEKSIWQLLLAFLFRNNFWASVSISDSDGNSLEGILKPFTVNYALLRIIEKNVSISYHLAGKGLSNTSNNTLADSSNSKDGKKKRNKMHKHLLQDVTWSSFYEAVFRQDDDCAPEMDLEEVIFAAESSKSKKLRFLKCWMRQMKKSSDCCQISLKELEVPPNVNEEVKERLEGSQLELDLPASSSPAIEMHHSVPIIHEASLFSNLEDLEAFLRTIPQKIQHGVCSKEVDLWNLAERLVGQSIDALYAKVGSSEENDSVCKELEDASVVNVSSEVSCLLLLKPKDLLLKYKSTNSAPLTSDQSSANYSAENIIREHELQILFRMELLQSKITANFEENVKQKMIKEICLLLQNIEFYLQGDFLCGESLLEFAGRTIKSRYAHSLGDVIHKIYREMEFFSFDDNEMEASDSLPPSNSEEPNTDGNENNIVARGAFDPTARAFTSQTTFHPQESNLKDQQFIDGEAHNRKLMKAQERRDRARRFLSFTSWVPDLHRVWALKQARTEKPMLEYFPKSKTKGMKRERNKNEIVCETPMSGKKHSHLQQDESRGAETACGLLSKALFQHE